MRPTLEPKGRDYRQWRKEQKLEAKKNRRLGQRRRAQGNVCLATQGKTERQLRQERARELRAREALKRPLQDAGMRRVIYCTDIACKIDGLHEPHMLGLEPRHRYSQPETAEKFFDTLDKIDAAVAEANEEPVREGGPVVENR